MTTTAARVLRWAARIRPANLTLLGIARPILLVIVALFVVFFTFQRSIDGIVILLLLLGSLIGIPILFIANLIIVVYRMVYALIAHPEQGGWLVRVKLGNILRFGIGWSICLALPALLFDLEVLRICAALLPVATLAIATLHAAFAPLAEPYEEGEAIPPGNNPESIMLADDATPVEHA